MTFFKCLSVYCIVFFVITITKGQKGLTGSTYIERQLLCALEKGPCDVLGRQVKGMTQGVVIYSFTYISLIDIMESCYNFILIKLSL